MKILVIGLDKKILELNSEVGNRAIQYGALVDIYEILVPNSKKVIQQLASNVRVVGSGGQNKFLQLINIFRIARKSISENKINVISIQDVYFLGLLGVLLSKICAVGLEIQVHGWEKHFGLRKLITMFVLSMANSIRVVSKRLKKELEEEYGISDGKITVVPVLLNGKVENVGVVTKSPNFVFLTVARLVKVKNVDIQILAAAELKKKGIKFEWWIIGDGSEKNRLINLSKKLLVEDVVKFLGWKNKQELALYYRTVDCFVLTSKYEGWGMVVVEAAEAGLPIIMTDVGCAGELIIDKESGLIVKDFQELVLAAVKIMIDKELRVRLSQEVKKVIGKLPSAQEALKLYLESWQKAKL